MPKVTTNGIETYYEDTGDGQPLVVLHGATADHQAWAEQLQPLTDDYRVICYDLRGHGKTSGSDHDTYTTNMYADDLAAFIDALDLEQPVVLGHSLGGMVGYVFADTYPEKLSGLVTMGARTSKEFSLPERGYATVINRVMIPLSTSETVMNAMIWATKRLFPDDSQADINEWEEIRAGHECDVPELSADEQSKF